MNLKPAFTTCTACACSFAVACSFPERTQDRLDAGEQAADADDEPASGDRTLTRIVAPKTIPSVPPPRNASGSAAPPPSAATAPAASDAGIIPVPAPRPAAPPLAGAPASAGTAATPPPMAAGAGTRATPPPSPRQPAAPSGEAMPVGDLPGWKQIFTDDFTKDAALGSWGSDDPHAVVYTGDGGGSWQQYPPSYKDTRQKRPYRSDAVLSVKNGVLNFHLHRVDGQPAGANPAPILPSGTPNQTYGRYSARFKTDTVRAEPYYVAWLLWPESEQWPDDGEEDFPEGSLSGNIGGFHHYAGPMACVGCQDAAHSDEVFTDWHTYTIEWTPDRVKYLLDGVTILDSTTGVPNTAMRWQLQTETSGDATDNVVNLDVDWVAIYAYEP